jgi:protease-4
MIDYYDQSNKFIGSNTDDVKKGSIATISLSGVMMTQDTLCDYGLESFDKQMRSLYRSSSVEAIIIKLDSGGGQSDAGDVMYNTLSDRNKPVIIHATMMASAALKGGLKADERIGISESTIVGSIGTMLSIPKWYVEEAKENQIDLFSKSSPNKQGAWRALLAGDPEPYIEELTKNDEIFMAQVKKDLNLKGTLQQRKETLSGSIFLGKDAKARGLIDGIGSFNYALKRAKSHINNSKF